jgi:Phage capsid family
MNAPARIPLRPDPNAIRRAGIASLMRTATALVLAAERRDSPRQDPVKLAERMWPGDRDVGLLTRAASSPATTTSASALAHVLTEYFIQSLSPVSAAAILLQRTLQLSFNHNALLSVPGFVADASGGFVGEGMPIPARSLLAQPLQLLPSKFATISALTQETVAGSGGNAEKMVADVLTRSVGLALDAALFDSNPAVAELRPAGLRSGVTASVASAGTVPLDAMISDLETLVGVVAPIAGTEPIILIAAPARAKTMPLRSLTLRDNPSFIILPSAAIAAGDLIAVVPTAIASATDGAPEISVARETVLHMEDTSPQQIVSAGTLPVVAAPATSLFQTDVLALKCRMEVTWGKRDPRAVAWLTTSAW